MGTSVRAAPQGHQGCSVPNVMLSPVPQVDKEWGQAAAGSDVCWQLTPDSSRAELVSLELAGLCDTSAGRDLILKSKSWNRELSPPFPRELSPYLAPLPFPSGISQERVDWVSLAL